MTYKIISTVLVCLAILVGCASKLSSSKTGTTEKAFQNIPGIEPIKTPTDIRKSEVIKYLMKNLEPIRYEYQKRLREKPELQGVIKFKFMVTPEGEVINASLEKSSVGDTLLEQSVIRRVSKWRLEPYNEQKDTILIVYPLVFSNK